MEGTIINPQPRPTPTPPESAQPAPSNHPVVASPKKHSNKASLVFTILIIIILVGAVGGVYVWQHKKVTQLSANVTQLNTKITSLTSQISSLNAQVTQLKASSSSSTSTEQIDNRNSQRTADINTILNAVYQYSIDNSGNLPSTITTTSTDICSTGASSCKGLIDLSVLTASSKYLVAIPKDPQTGTATDSHYAISKKSNGQVTVTAPSAEAGKTISVTR